MNNFFSITINTFNHVDWIERCLRSCVNQNYHEFEVLVLDDISNDGTWEICQKIRDEFGEKIKIFRNEEKVYSQLKNIYSLTLASKENSIVISVDGDDWLKDDNVLSKLNEIYNSGDIWLTYGRYEQFPDGTIPGSYHAYPSNIISENLFRDYNWIASHLKTYRKELFKKIEKSDFMFDNGEWFDVTGDQAFMLPMLEMAGERSRFVESVLYVYNVANPTRDGATKVHRQEEVARYIRSKKKYQRIENL